MDFLRYILFLPPGASTLSESVDLLHVFVISVTMVGSTGVFLAGLWFMWRYPRRRGVPTTPRVTAPLWFEVLVIGSLLGLFLLWWVIGYGQYRTMQAAPRNAIDVYVVAKQWMWQFSDEHGRRSQSVIVVPRGQPVRLVMTSRDVIHSFFVPDFRLKRDVVPGMYTSLWFQAERAGTFDVYCAEYCGLEHSLMRAAIVALEPRDYERWLEGQTPEEVLAAEERVPRLGDARAGARDMAAEGREIAARFACLSCHTVTGEPHIGPTWRGLYGSREPLAGGGSVLADDAYLTESMMQPELHVVEGYEDVMPSYRGILSAADTAALVEYIRSLREPAEPLPVELPEVVPVGEPAR